MTARPGRVQAWQVETGEASELDWPPSPETLRSTIVLGADGTRLDTSGAPPVGTVFIYSRKTLEAETPEPEAFTIEIGEAAEPALPPRAEPHTNPMLAAYQAFEYQFMLHAAKGKALRDAIERRRELSGRLFSEAEAQVRGMRAAQGNVEATHRELMGEYAQFRELFSQRHAAHASLLNSFEDDMRRLLAARLHPALATPQRQTLLDCIPEARFRSWAETCRQEHLQLQARVVELDAMMRELREAVESDPQRNVVDMEPLRRMHARSAETVHTAAAQSEVFERDLDAIRSTLRTSLAALQAARQFNWASCDGFSTMQKAHEKQLVELSDADRLSKDTLAFFAQTKNRLRREVWHRLRTVAALQNRVRDAYNRLAVFRQALQRQTSACDQLLTLHEMPAAYQASLEEVHRRQRFGRQLTQALERISARLDAARETELGRRENFLEKRGRFILKDLVPGLDEPLPSLQLAPVRLDTALPDLGAAPAPLAAEDEALILEAPSARALEAETMSLRARVRELEDRARALAATASSSASSGGMKVGSGEEMLAKAERQRDEYVARIGALEAKLSRMYELNNQLQTKLHDTETMASVVAASPDPETRARLQEAENSVARLREESSRLKHELEQKEAELARVRDDLTAKLREVEGAAAAAREQSAKDINTARAEAARAQAEREELEKHTETLKAQAAEMEREVNRVRGSSGDQRAAQEREIALLRQELNAQLLALQTSLADKEKQLKELSNESALKQQSWEAESAKQRERALRENEELQKQVRELQQQVAERDKLAGEAAAAQQRLQQQETLKKDEALKQQAELVARTKEDLKALQNAVTNALKNTRVSLLQSPPNASETQLAAWGVTQLATEFGERGAREEQARKNAESLSAALAAAEKRAAELLQKVEELSSQVLARTLELQDMKAQAKPSAPSPSVAAQKAQREAIALRDFDAGDIAMFFKNHLNVYEAYSYVRGGARTPKYYLSEDSFATFEKERAASLVIMGTVISREQLKATGSDYTRLPAGEIYYELIVQRLE